MQRGVVVQEGGPYRPESYLRPESVAGAVLLAVSAPDDTALTELVLRPAGA
jgi:NADP-dependent 3-hydroxy acid dehydrogenase YdfG